MPNCGRHHALVERTSPVDSWLVIIHGIVSQTRPAQLTGLVRRRYVLQQPGIRRNRLTRRGVSVVRSGTLH